MPAASSGFRHALLLTDGSASLPVDLAAPACTVWQAPAEACYGEPVVASAAEALQACGADLLIVDWPPVPGRARARALAWLALEEMRRPASGHIALRGWPGERQPPIGADPQRLPGCCLFDAKRLDDAWPALWRSEGGAVACPAGGPLVNVIVRSMDRPTLDAALDSVAWQTHRPIEVVVVNARGTGHRGLDPTHGGVPLRMVGDAGGAPLPRPCAATAGLETARGEFVLFHVNADQLPVARANLDAAWFEVPHRIGYWAWELEDFPPQWHDAFAHVDELWWPSSFCQNAAEAVSPVPVLCIPHAIEIPERVTSDRARFELRPDSVVFLSMADMMSVTERKNPLGAVHAFVEAFAPDDARAELWSRSRTRSGIPRPSSACARSRRRNRECSCWPTTSTAQLSKPLDSIDVFVSLHRSEGLDLGIAEAMARGKVALATGWSGNMDFISPLNSLPVDYELVRLERDAGPYTRGERWAKPSIADTVDKMRTVAANSALRLRLGQRARHDCGQQLAPRVVGARVAARLRASRKAKNL